MFRAGGKIQSTVMCCRMLISRAYNMAGAFDDRLVRLVFVQL